MDFLLLSLGYLDVSLLMLILLLGLTHVDVSHVADVSKVHAASNFRVQNPEDEGNKYSKTSATLSTPTWSKEGPKTKSTSKGVS
jgi:hypothetical protein